MSGLGEDPIMYFRDNEAPTVSIYLTPVQFLTPSPALSNINRSKVVESLANDKDQTIQIATQVLQQSIELVKSFEADLLTAKMSDDFLQTVQIFMFEDLLFAQHNIDIEDFKQTAVHHNLLNHFSPFNIALNQGFESLK